MNILWLSWKDHEHPTAGGAEVIKSALAKQLAADGHTVIVLTARYKGSAAHSTHNGYTVIRRGNRLTVYWHAYRYFRRQLKYWPDLIIDEMNTLPFFARFYARQPVVLLVHQLAREVWLHELPFHLGRIGYFLEPLYLRLLRTLPVITVSQSTKDDLIRYGFTDSAVHIIPEIVDQTLKSKVAKATHPTLLAHGAIRSMKQTHHILEAFLQAKATIPELQLHVSGKALGSYGARITKAITTHPFANDIYFHGSVTPQQKADLMASAHYLVAASIKEGWGLIVSEAALLGTPAIVYDVDGLRDAVGRGKYGYLSAPNPKALATTIVQAFQQPPNYSVLQHRAQTFAARLTPELAYSSFIKVVSRYNMAKNTTDPAT